MITLVLSLLLIGTLVLVLPDRRVRVPVKSDRPRARSRRS
jgi:hypothetical protein